MLAADCVAPLRDSSTSRVIGSLDSCEDQREWKETLLIIYTSVSKHSIKWLYKIIAGMKWGDLDFIG